MEEPLETALRRGRGIGGLSSPMGVQSWVTIKKTEISAQHEFLRPIYLCVYRGIVLIYLDVHQKC